MPDPFLVKNFYWWDVRTRVSISRDLGVGHSDLANCGCPNCLIVAFWCYILMLECPMAVFYPDGFI